MSRLGVAITWLGHAAFHLAPDGEAPPFLFDPWLANPKAPRNAVELAADAKVILVTHGHSDHVSGVVELAGATGATVLTTVEVAADLSADGLDAEQLVGFNVGGAAESHGLRATLVHAQHSSSRDNPDGRPRELGNPCGFVVELPGGPVIYNTGDTGVFSDMALIAELYDPDILMLPIGDFYTMGARQAAKAVELVEPRWIVPQHYATFPALTGTFADFRQALDPSFRDRLLELVPGEAVH